MVSIFVRLKWINIVFFDFFLLLIFLFCCFCKEMGKLLNFLTNLVVAEWFYSIHGNQWTMHMPWRRRGLQYLNCKDKKFGGRSVVQPQINLLPNAAGLFGYNIWMLVSSQGCEFPRSDKIHRTENELNRKRFKLIGESFILDNTCFPF